MDLGLADTLWTRCAGHCLTATAIFEIAKADAIESGAADIDKAVFNGKYSASIHLLVGNAYELCLKSAFLLHDGDPKKLRGIGHDLKAALDQAEACGFTSNVDNLRWVVEHLRDSHVSHQFRYGGRDAFEMAGLESSLPRLQAVVEEVHDLLDARSAEMKTQDEKS